MNGSLPTGKICDPGGEGWFLRASDDPIDKPDYGRGFFYLGDSFFADFHGIWWKGRTSSPSAPLAEPSWSPPDTSDHPVGLCMPRRLQPRH